MAITTEKIAQYTGILKSELKVAMGCTEPIAIAYCAAYARKVLGRKPERYEVFCSGNIIKNVKAVTVPKTGGMKGIEAAVLAGALGGDPDAELEVLTNLTDRDREEIREELKKDIVKVSLLESSHVLHIIVYVFAGEEEVSVEIIDSHTKIGKIARNGEVIQDGGKPQGACCGADVTDLNILDILEYADKVDLEEVRDTLERQIDYNSAISDEGLRNVYGAGIGPLLEKNAGRNIQEHAKAAAAAGSDARMNGCALPVVINSGSGNQGITVSLPIIVYAREMGKSREELMRALCVGNLVAIHQKAGIGALSAFCGATCAAVGSVAGIAYMQYADYETISLMVTNALATVSGMVCDGAKSSCAGKIATALESAFIGYEAAKLRRGYRSGEGIVKRDVERTIDSVARMAARGMHSTDIEILNIMLEK